MLPTVVYLVGVNLVLLCIAESRYVCRLLGLALNTGVVAHFWWRPNALNCHLLAFVQAIKLKPYHGMGSQAERSLERDLSCASHTNLPDHHSAGVHSLMPSLLRH